MKDFQLVYEILKYQEAKYPQIKAVNFLEEGNIKSISIKEVIQLTDILSCWLLAQGLNKDDKVAILPRLGNPWWLILDFALQQIGAVVVPLHPTASLEDHQFIVNETQAVFLCVADASLDMRAQELKSQCASLRQVHYITDMANSSSTHADVIKGLEERKKQITPDQLVAILYTSGTEGVPKGVMLTHINLVSTIKSVLPVFPLEPGQRVLSFLPFSHVFERTACYAYLAFGVEIYFAASLDKLSETFKKVRPHFCTSVPRTLEKMVDVLNEKAHQKNRISKRVILWAMRVGEKFQEKKKQDAVYPLKLFVAYLLVLSRFKRALGGKINYIVVGAAALQPEIGRLFSAAGIKILSGYGMTETSPFIAVNRTEPGLNRFGSVGIPLPGVEVKIESIDDSQGEILVKGPNVMQGYYNRPEVTAQVFTEDGWLRTGDIGHWQNKRFLVITDRKKDIFKTSTGKYVAPQPLENYFKTSPFILQSVIVGFNRPFVSAIIVPNFNILKAWCEENQIHWTAPGYMIHNIKVIKKIQDEVDLLNEKLQNHERVRKFTLCDEEWTTDNKLLTTSFKVKRKPIEEKYQKEIEKLYR